MTSIYFDKDEYKAGETATITYVDAPARSLVAVRRGGTIIHRKVLTSGGSGSHVYNIPTTLGTYKAELWSEGGIIAHDTMEVVTGAAPPADKGTLKVNTTPTGASVTVSGVSCGTTPVTACEVSAGSKTVTITKVGYNTATRSVTITAGQTSDLGIITLTPTGAPPLGFTDTGKVTPSTIEVDPATYDVMFKKSGYKDKIVSNVVVSEGATKPVSATLELKEVPPVTKTVTFVSVPSGASVNVVPV